MYFLWEFFLAKRLVEQRLCDIPRDNSLTRPLEECTMSAKVFTSEIAQLTLSDFRRETL